MVVVVRSCYRREGAEEGLWVDSGGGEGSLAIDGAEHDILRADDGDHVRQHVALRHKVQTYHPPPSTASTAQVKYRNNHARESSQRVAYPGGGSNRGRESCSGRGVMSHR